MRIAVNARFLLKNKQEGIGGYTLEVMRRLVQWHPEHEFLFLFDRPFDPSFVFGKNVTPLVLFPPARHPFLFVWWFEWAVPQALRRWQADMFFSPDNFLSLRAKVPTVLVTHDLAHVHFPRQLSFFDRLYYRIFAPKFNRKARRILAVSEFTRQDMVKNYGIAPTKIAVTGNGCREIFQPLSTEKKQAVRQQYAAGEAYFYYVGAVHPRKNIPRLLQAFDRFKTATGSPAKLLLAGRMAWKTGEVEAAFHHATHRCDIHFLGYVSDAEAARLMGAALALTYVSLFEGFGVPLLEAMHCDVPILTSSVSSMPEVAGDAALLAPPQSVEAIAAALQRLWENTALRQELIEAGRQQRQQFNWNKTACIVWDNLLQAAAELPTGSSL